MTKDSEIRTFIAIPLPDDVKKNLLDAQESLKKQTDFSVKWVSMDSMHITIKFLGEIEEFKIEEISRCMKETLVDISPFACQIQGIGVFPDLRRPQVIWAGITGSEQILSNMHKRFDDKMSSIGIPKEGKDFHAHITFGRVKNGAPNERFSKALKTYEKTSFGKVDCNSVILFKSVLQRTGAVYTPLFEVKLSKT